MKIIYSRQHLSYDPDQVWDSASNEFISHYDNPERVEEIFSQLVTGNFSDISPPEDILIKDLESIHQKDFLFFLNKLAESEQTFVPDSFANFKFRKKPDTMQGLLGYYCTDTQTPFSSSAYSGVLYSVGAVLTGAKILFKEKQPVYALTHPPGHHAGRNFYPASKTIKIKWYGPGSKG